MVHAKRKPTKLTDLVDDEGISLLQLLEAVGGRSIASVVALPPSTSTVGNILVACQYLRECGVSLPDVSVKAVANGDESALRSIVQAIIRWEATALPYCPSIHAMCLSAGKEAGTYEALGCWVQRRLGLLHSAPEDWTDSWTTGDLLHDLVDELTHGLVHSPPIHEEADRGEINPVSRLRETLERAEAALGIPAPFSAELLSNMHLAEVPSPATVECLVLSFVTSLCFRVEVGYPDNGDEEERDDEEDQQLGFAAAGPAGTRSGPPGADVPGRLPPYARSNAPLIKRFLAMHSTGALDHGVHEWKESDGDGVSAATGPTLRAWYTFFRNPVVPHQGLSLRAFRHFLFRIRLLDRLRRAILADSFSEGPDSYETPGSVRAYLYAAVFEDMTEEPYLLWYDFVACVTEAAALVQVGETTSDRAWNRSPQLLSLLLHEHLRPAAVDEGARSSRMSRWLLAATSFLEQFPQSSAADCLACSRTHLPSVALASEPADDNLAAEEETLWQDRHPLGRVLVSNCDALQSCFVHYTEDSVEVPSDSPLVLSPRWLALRESKDWSNRRASDPYVLDGTAVHRAVLSAAAEHTSDETRTADQGFEEHGDSRIGERVHSRDSMVLESVQSPRDGGPVASPGEWRLQNARTSQPGQQQPSFSAGFGKRPIPDSRASSVPRSAKFSDTGLPMDVAPLQLPTQGPAALPRHAQASAHACGAAGGGGGGGGGVDTVTPAHGGIFLTPTGTPARPMGAMQGPMRHSPNDSRPGSDRLCGSPRSSVPPEEDADIHDMIEQYRVGGGYVSPGPELDEETDLQDPWAPLAGNGPGSAMRSRANSVASSQGSPVLRVRRMAALDALPPRTDPTAARTHVHALEAERALEDHAKQCSMDTLQHAAKPKDKDEHSPHEAEDDVHSIRSHRSFRSMRSAVVRPSPLLRDTTGSVARQSSSSEDHPSRNDMPRPQLRPRAASSCWQEPSDAPGSAAPPIPDTRRVVESLLDPTGGRPSRGRGVRRLVGSFSTTASRSARLPSWNDKEGTDTAAAIDAHQPAPRVDSGITATSSRTMTSPEGAGDVTPDEGNDISPSPPSRRLAVLPQLNRVRDELSLERADEGDLPPNALQFVRHRRLRRKLAVLSSSNRRGRSRRSSRHSLNHSWGSRSRGLTSDRAQQLHQRSLSLTHVRTPGEHQPHSLPPPPPPHSLQPPQEIRSAQSGSVFLGDGISSVDFPESPEGAYSVVSCPAHPRMTDHSSLAHHPRGWRAGSFSGSNWSLRSALTEGHTEGTPPPMDASPPRPVSRSPPQRALAERLGGGTNASMASVQEEEDEYSIGQLPESASSSRRGSDEHISFLQSLTGAGLPPSLPPSVDTSRAVSSLQPARGSLTNPAVGTGPTQRSSTAWDLLHGKSAPTPASRRRKLAALEAAGAARRQLRAVGGNTPYAANRLGLATGTSERFLRHGTGQEKEEEGEKEAETVPRTVVHPLSALSSVAQSAFPTVQHHDLGVVDEEGRAAHGTNTLPPEASGVIEHREEPVQSVEVLPGRTERVPSTSSYLSSSISPHISAVSWRSTPPPSWSLGHPRITSTTLGQQAHPVAEEPVRAPTTATTPEERRTPGGGPIATVGVSRRSTESLSTSRSPEAGSLSGDRGRTGSMESARTAPVTRPSVPRPPPRPAVSQLRSASRSPPQTRWRAISDTVSPLHRSAVQGAAAVSREQMTEETSGSSRQPVDSSVQLESSGQGSGSGGSGSGSGSGSSGTSGPSGPSGVSGSGSVQEKVAPEEVGADAVSTPVGRCCSPPSIRYTSSPLARAAFRRRASSPHRGRSRKPRGRQRQASVVRAGRFPGRHGRGGGRGSRSLSASPSPPPRVARLRGSYFRALQRLRRFTRDAGKRQLQLQLPKPVAAKGANYTPVEEEDEGDLVVESSPVSSPQSSPGPASTGARLLNRHSPGRPRKSGKSMYRVPLLRWNSLVRMLEDAGLMGKPHDKDVAATLFHQLAVSSGVGRSGRECLTFDRFLAFLVRFAWRTRMGSWGEEDPQEYTTPYASLLGLLEHWSAIKGAAGTDDASFVLVFVKPSPRGRRRSGRGGGGVLQQQWSTWEMMVARMLDHAPSLLSS